MVCCCGQPKGRLQASQLPFPDHVEIQRFRLTAPSRHPSANQRSEASAHLRSEASVRNPVPPTSGDLRSEASAYPRQAGTCEAKRARIPDKRAPAKRSERVTTPPSQSEVSRENQKWIPRRNPSRRVRITPKTLQNAPAGKGQNNPALEGGAGVGGVPPQRGGTLGRGDQNHHVI